MHLQLTTVPVRETCASTVTGDNRGGQWESAKATRPSRAPCSARSRGTRPGPPRRPSAGGVEAVAVARPVPSGRARLPWGMLAAIDLHGCERSRLDDPDTLRRFVPSLINAIGMRAHGPLALDRFGDGELEGWSAMQFIETSSITVHADEVCGRCFVDVFFSPAVRLRRRGRSRRRAFRRHVHAE